MIVVTGGTDESDASVPKVSRRSLDHFLRLCVASLAVYQINYDGDHVDTTFHRSVDDTIESHP